MNGHVLIIGNGTTKPLLPWLMNSEIQPSGTEIHGAIHASSTGFLGNRVVDIVIQSVDHLFQAFY